MDVAQWHKADGAVLANPKLATRPLWMQIAETAPGLLPPQLAGLPYWSRRRLRMGRRGRMPSETIAALRRRGHDVEMVDNWLARAA